MDSLCQDKFTKLYQEIRKNRKSYQEEHCRIAAQFNHVSLLVILIINQKKETNFPLYGGLFKGETVFYLLNKIAFD